MPPGRKRKAAARPARPESAQAAESSAHRRRSGRISSSFQQSSDFEAGRESDGDADGGPPTKKTKACPGGVVTSGRGRARKAFVAESEGSSGSDAYEEDEGDEQDGDEESDPDGGDADEAKPMGKARKSGPSARPAAEEGDDDDEDVERLDDEAPGKLTFIPLPKLRSTGGASYEDDRLHPNTLLFLKDLKANNQRTWLKMNDGEYRRSLQDWESYVTTMTEKITAADETIPELPFKDVNFRIYRDVRFSKNPMPYKTHYGAAWSRTGRKGPYACYYVHCEPGACFVGGGLWHPDAGAVARLRASIDERSERWRRILMDPAFRRTWLPAASSAAQRARKSGGAEEEAAVKQAFAAHNQENALKTKPKGFIADHKDIELLRLRNFTVSKKVPDDIFTRDHGQEEITGYFKDLVGFVTHLNRIVMPDPGATSDGE